MSPNFTVFRFVIESKGERVRLTSLLLVVNIFKFPPEQMAKGRIPDTRLLDSWDPDTAQTCNTQPLISHQESVSGENVETADISDSKISQNEKKKISIFICFRINIHNSRIKHHIEYFLCRKGRKGER